MYEFTGGTGITNSNPIAGPSLSSPAHGGPTNLVSEDCAAKATHQQHGSCSGGAVTVGGVEEDAKDYYMTLSVCSNGKTWHIRRNYRNLRKFDRQLHKCVHDRKFSGLQELPKLDFTQISSPEQLEVCSLLCLRVLPFCFCVCLSSCLLVPDLVPD